MTPIHDLLSYSCEIHFNIVLLSTHRSYKWAFYFTFPHQKHCMYFFSPPYVPHVSLISYFLIWSPEWSLVRSTDNSASHYGTFSSRLSSASIWGQNTPFGILFSNTLSLGSSLDVRDQIAHPYQTTGRIIVMYVNPYIVTQQRQDERLVAVIPWILYALSFCMHANFVYYCLSEIFEFCHPFEGFITHLYIVILSRILVSRVGHALSFPNIYF
jgi:hypothetical protein